MKEFTQTHFNVKPAKDHLPEHIQEKFMKEFTLLKSLSNKINVNLALKNWHALKETS